MIAKLMALSVRARWAVLFLFLVIAGLGVWQLTKLPIDAVPDITNNQIQINVRAPALSPELVEKQVADQAAAIAPFEYSALAWALVLDWLFWHTVPDAWTLGGGALIIASGLWLARSEAPKATSKQPVAS